VAHDSVPEDDFEAALAAGFNLSDAPKADGPPRDDQRQASYVAAGDPAMDPFKGNLRIAVHLRIALQMMELGFDHIYAAEETARAATYGAFETDADGR
jgi:hypothetical protein